MSFLSISASIMIAANLVSGDATATTKAESPDTRTNTPVSTSLVSLKLQEPSPIGRSPLEMADVYPEDYGFTVYRKGKKIGRHDVAFTREGDELKVYNDMRLRVKFLFVTAYKLDYKSTEIWQNGELTAVSSFINNNGDKLTMGGGLADETFGWETIKEERMSLPRGGEYFPTNHWYTKVLNKTQLLNTLTGNLIDIAITSEGWETLETQNGNILAERFQYSGELDSTVWYDTKGRWVGLEFAAKDGSKIRYKCNQCASWQDMPVLVETAR